MVRRAGWGPHPANISDRIIAAANFFIALSNVGGIKQPDASAVWRRFGRRIDQMRTGGEMAGRNR
jgi:hypothetical protein